MSQTERKVFFVQWPIYQYEAMLPEAIEDDVFVWLYLSLLVYNNKLQHKPPRNYDESVVADTEALILQKFSPAINKTILEGISNRIQADFCVKDYSRIIGLKDDVDGFLNSFEYLFNDDVQVKTVYKDAVTGAILPFFDRVFPNREGKNADPVINPVASVVPSVKLILKAIKDEQRVGKSEEPVKDEDEGLSEFFDPNQESFFSDDDLKFDEKEPEESEPKTGARKNYSVKVLDNSRQTLYFRLVIYRDDDKSPIKVDAPQEFPIALTAWFNMIFAKAKSSNSQVADLIKQQFPAPAIDLSRSGVSSEESINIFGEGKKLRHCEELYSVVSNSLFKKKEMQSEVIGIDENFDTIYCMMNLGRLLDYLGGGVMNAERRQSNQMSQDLFALTVSGTCTALGVDDEGNHAITRYAQIRSNYEKYYNRGTTFDDFKLELLDLLLSNSRLRESKFLYPQFISDAFSLYRKRSLTDHPKNDELLNDGDIARLTNLAKLLIDVQGGK